MGGVDLATFRALLGSAGQRALAAASTALDEAPAILVASRLRRDHPPDLAAAALTQATLRRRARTKFAAADADRMYFTRDGLEQATRASVAAHRARRFAAARPGRVGDLCCGIGGDAIELARAGLRTFAVDRNPLNVEIVRANAAALGLADRVDVRCADVESIDLAGLDAIFCDPARRAARGRIFDPDAYSPPWSFVEGLPRRIGRTSIKVAPGFPHARVPDDAEAEWISDTGEVKEATLWFGDLATTARRRATLLPSGATLTNGDPPAVPTVGPAGRYLYEPDGAVIRAGLVAECAATIGGHLLDPMIAYVTSDELARTPFARVYEITDVLPFQLKRLRATLRGRDIGRLTIKKRGMAITPDDLRARLDLHGPNEATVILTRARGRPLAILAHPSP